MVITCPALPLPTSVTWALRSPLQHLDMLPVCPWCIMAHLIRPLGHNNPSQCSLELSTGTCPNPRKHVGERGRVCTQPGPRSCLAGNLAPWQVTLLPEACLSRLFTQLHSSGRWGLPCRLRAHCRNAASACLSLWGRQTCVAFSPHGQDRGFPSYVIMLHMWDSKTGTELHPGCQGPSCFSFRCLSECEGHRKTGMVKRNCH